jgi:hypothetical protein
VTPTEVGIMQLPDGCHDLADRLERLRDASDCNFHPTSIATLKMERNDDGLPGGASRRVARTLTRYRASFRGANEGRPGRRSTSRGLRGCSLVMRSFPRLQLPVRRAILCVTVGVDDCVVV